MLKTELVGLASDQRLIVVGRTCQRHAHGLGMIGDDPHAEGGKVHHLRPFGRRVDDQGVAAEPAHVDDHHNPAKVGSDEFPVRRRRQEVLQPFELPHFRYDLIPLPGFSPSHFGRARRPGYSRIRRFPNRKGGGRHRVLKDGSQAIQPLG